MFLLLYIGPLPNKEDQSKEEENKCQTPSWTRIKEIRETYRKIYETLFDDIFSMSTSHDDHSYYLLLFPIIKSRENNCMDVDIVLRF